MRRPARAVLFVALATALVAAAACGKGKSGNPVSTSPTPTPPAPQNVTVSSGNHTLHLTWATVTNATGYRIYSSGSAITGTNGLTPVFVNAPPYDLSGLPNWQPVHFAVAADIAAAQGPLSADVAGTPTAGHVVADDGSDVKYFHADETSVSDQTIAGAQLFTLGSTPIPVLVGTTGALFGITTSGGFAKVGIARADGPITFANPAGGGVITKWLGTTLGRALFERSHGAATYDVVSYPVDGSAPGVTIASGCTTPITNTIANAAGVAIACQQGTTTMFYSADAASQGLQFTNVQNGDVLSGLSASRIYIDRSLRVFAMALTSGSATPTDLDIGASGQTTLFAIGASRLLVENHDSSNKYNLITYDFDGANQANAALGSTTPFAQSSRTPVTADGHEFLVTDGAGNSILYLDDGSTGLLETGPSATVTDAFLIPNARVLDQIGTTGYRVMTQGVVGTPAVEIHTYSSAPGTFLSAHGDWALVYDGTGGTLKAYGTNANATTSLSSAPKGPAVFRDDLGVTWLENDGYTYYGTADGSVTRTKIDGTMSTNLYDGGTAADGRSYLIEVRSAGGNQVVMWTATATSAQLIAPGAGAFLN